MGETAMRIYNDKGLVDSQELETYLTDEVYNNVEFYECSDGHYLGENGVVEIELQDDQLSFFKTGHSEYEDYVTDTEVVQVEDWVKQVILEKIESMSGTTYTNWEDPPFLGDTAINYRGDCIITERDEEAIRIFAQKMRDQSLNHEFDIEQGDGDSVELTDDGLRFNYEHNEKLECQLETRYYLTREL